MVRSVADRAFLPTKNVLEEVGDMMILTGKTIVSALRPPYPYGGEFVSQFLFALKLCWFPLLVSTVAFGYAAPGLQAANFLVLFGALDRLGGFFVLASIREFAPFVDAVVLAGVAGTAFTADLGARKIREELDALQVLGVDPVKNLVVPRFLALMLVTGLFDVFAVMFGIFGGVIATLVNGAPLGPFWATFFTNASVTDLWGSVLKCTLFGAIIAIVCCYKGHDCLGRRRGRRARGQPGGGHRVPRRVRVQLRVHADAARHASRDHGDPLMSWLTVPRDWIAGFGEIVKFGGKVLGQVYGLRVFRFFGEALRQAGILILSSTLVIWGLVFIIGLQCGIEGAYFNRSVGAPAYAGVFSAWCDLRELVPYGFGYMMAAKVGTGIVAELGSMRISDEIDALEVMGIDSMVFLCATRLLAAWLVLPFIYISAVGAGFLASYLAVVQQIGEVSSGGFFLVFWMFQNPPDLLYSVLKGMFMATAIVLVGCYYGYNASGGPVGVGTATAKSMVMNIVLVHLIGMLGTQLFWGANPRAPIGG
jgi:phospholipid/cholesterol/gamma-HCH transport system permease protein